MIRIILMLLLVCQLSFAKEEDEGLFDRFHSYFSGKIKTMSKSFDSLFGDLEFEDTKGSTVTVEQYFTSIEDQSMINETRVRARWVFPNMKRKLKLVIRQTPRVNEGNQQDQEAELLTRADRNRENFAAGLNYDVADESAVKFSLESGILVRNPIDPYIRTRFRLKKYYGWTNLFLTQKVFLYRNDGFGSSLKVDMRSKINDFKTYTYGNYFFWFDETDRLDYITGPSYVHKLSMRRTISYNWKMLFTNKPTEMLSSHQLFINYRQLIHKKWLYVELIPSLEFPKENDWEKIAALTIKIQAIFGDVR